MKTLEFIVLELFIFIVVISFIQKYDIIDNNKSIRNLEILHQNNNEQLVTFNKRINILESSIKEIQETLKNTDKAIKTLQESNEKRIYNRLWGQNDIRQKRLNYSYKK